jgi:hypothetical protein
LPRVLFAGDRTLAQVAGRLVSALERAGNAEFSFYSAPGGFALVARLERIRSDARSFMVHRFVAMPSGQHDPLEFFEALFFARPGDYRQIVFIVTDRDYGYSAWRLTPEEAASILSGGASALTQDYETLPFGPRHRVSALIYEFRKHRDGDSVVLLPGAHPASRHLRRSGLLNELRAN